MRPMLFLIETEKISQQKEKKESKEMSKAK